MLAWSNFYILVGTAAATLVGLMFVAITLGSKLITKESSSRARRYFSPVLYHYAHIFLISCFALFPGETSKWFGITVLGFAIYRMFEVTILFNQMRRTIGKNSELELSDWLINLIFPTILYLSFIICGYFAIYEASWSLPGIAVTILALTVLGIVAAWDLLIWFASKLD